MAGERKGRKRPAVNLFPFLDILACLIGNLMLMITAVALQQMDNPTVADAERFEQARSRVEEERREIERLQAELAEMESRADEGQKQIAELRARRDQLERQRRELMDAQDRPVEVDVPKVDPEAHQRALAELEERVRRIEQETKELQQRLTERRRPREPEVVILPPGEGADQKPLFVECTAKGVVVHDGGRPEIPAGKLAASEELRDALARTAAVPGGTVVFLVREDGLGTLAAAQNVARASGARHGRVPVPGGGAIDLSQFRD